MIIYFNQVPGVKTKVDKSLTSQSFIYVYEGREKKRRESFAQNLAHAGVTRGVIVTLIQIVN